VKEIKREMEALVKENEGLKKEVREVKEELRGVKREAEEAGDGAGPNQRKARRPSGDVNSIQNGTPLPPSPLRE